MPQFCRSGVSLKKLTTQNIPVEFDILFQLMDYRYPKRRDEVYFSRENRPINNDWPIIFLALHELDVIKLGRKTVAPGFCANLVFWDF